MIGHAIVVGSFTVLIVAMADLKPAQTRLRVRIAVEPVQQGEGTVDDGEKFSPRVEGLPSWQSP